MTLKRKTKTLLYEAADENFIKGMIIISWIFFTVAASLLVISARADYSAWNRYAIFSWFDDKVEALDKLYLVDSEDLTKDVWSFYAKRNTGNDTTTTYLEYGYPLVVNRWNADSNYISSITENKSDLKSLVLWWISNSASWDNIIIFAWSNNVVKEWNDNATIRGGEGNKLLEKESEWVPSVMVWWKNNQISNGDWAIIIWGENNAWSSNAIILGWENNNAVVGGSIVAWSNINVDTQSFWKESNLFAFSNSEEEFKPNSKNTFYLNVSKWVWLNWEPFENWLHSHWAVSIGEIDISQPCTDANYWVEWFYNWCLVWCTSRSAEKWHWDLLNLTESCMGLCENGNLDCAWEVNDEPVEAGHCIFTNKDWKQDPYSESCSNSDRNKYKWVSFEYRLVDQDECPIWSENQCVFQCKDWYHLVDWACHKDCPLPAGFGKAYLKHNEEILWYKNNTYTCNSNCENNKWYLKCQDWTLNGDYKKPSCTTHANQECYADSMRSLYNQTTQDIDKAICSFVCTNYSVEDNMCKIDFKWYHCICDEWFEWNEDQSACIPK